MISFFVLNFYSCKKQQQTPKYSAVIIVGDYGKNYQKRFIFNNVKNYIRKYGLLNKYKVFTLDYLTQCNCNKFMKSIVIEPKRLEVKQTVFKEKLYCSKVNVSPFVEVKIFKNGKLQYESLETVKIEEKKCNDFAYPDISIEDVKQKALKKVSEILIKKYIN